MNFFFKQNFQLQKSCYELSSKNAIKSKTLLVKVDENLINEKDMRLLRSNLLTRLQREIFQNDSAPCNTLYATKRSIVDKDVKFLDDWPAVLISIQFNHCDGN